MTRMQLVVYEYDRGINLDLSNRAGRAVMSRGKHGDLRLDVTAMMDRDEAFAFYRLAGTPKLELNAGAIVIWSGRVEDIALDGAGVKLVAMGNWRATSDVVYTALWSTGSFGGWRALTPDLVAAHNPEKWRIDNNNRLYLAPVTGESFDNNNQGGIYLSIPDGSSREFQAVQFAVEFLAPTSSWIGRLTRYDGGFSGGTNSMTLTGSGALQSRAYYLEPADGDTLVFRMYYDGIKAAYTGETGVGAYMRITRLRVATTTTNKVNTTIASNITAGAATVTPASMARIYVGQELVITGTGSPGEIVTVTSITSTTFNATFALSHTASITVQGIVVYGDEIVKDVLAAEQALNGALNSSQILIESPAVDMVEARYEDRQGLTVIEDIAQRGDAEGNAWETGVYGDVLYLRPLGDDALGWAVDAQINLKRSVERLGNAVKAVHEDQTERLNRTAFSTDAASVAQWGMTRQVAADVHTSRGVEAEKVRNVVVATRAEPAPQVDLDFDEVFSAKGSMAEAWMLRGADTMLARNVAVTMDVPPDNSASFRIGRMDYDVMKDEVKVEVDAVTVVNTLAGVGENTDRRVVNGQRKPFLIAARG